MVKEETRNESLTGWNINTLKEHFSSLIDSNDRRYQESFLAIKEAVAAALAAQKELSNAAFASSEKAIVKAEDAQRDYNVRSNEFRGQLDDQAKTLMPRTETEAKFISVDEKFTSLIKSIDERFAILNKALEEKNEGIKISFEKSIGSIISDIKSLRESRSSIEGRGSGASSLWGLIIGAIGLLAVIIALFKTFSGK